jgi:hypothetical protein
MVEAIPQHGGDIFLSWEEGAVERRMRGRLCMGWARGSGVYWQDAVWSEGVVEVEVSQRERAAARKNVSLSRWARSSCSWDLSGRVTLQLRPGVEVL